METSQEPFKKPLLLVIDDDPAICLLVKESLMPHNFVVEQADSGEGGLILFDRLNPDLILLDINLPGIDGISVCAAIRDLPMGKFVPILIFTGSDDIDSINRAYQAGATDFITKPINWPILIHHVRYMLRAGQAIIDQFNNTQIQQLLADLTNLGNRHFDSLDELLEQLLKVIAVNPFISEYSDAGAVYLKKNTIFEKLADAGFGNFPELIQVADDDRTVLEAFGLKISVIELKASDLMVGLMVLKFTGRECAYDLKIRLLEAVSEKASQLVTHIRAELETQLAAEVFSNSFDAIAITDTAGNVLRVNNVFEQVTGYSSEEIIGRNFNLLKSGCQDDAFYQAMWGVLLKKGKWQGEIWNKRKNGEIYPEWLSISSVLDGKGQTRHFIAVFIDITQQKSQEERIQNLAYFDDLTGLANRTLLSDHMKLAVAQADRNGDAVAVLFIDLDRFKNINDSLGHVYGDQLLRAVADRFTSIVREGDTVARQGGDEFIVILTGLSAPYEKARMHAANIAVNFLKTLAKPIYLSHHEIQITGSIGISLYPYDALSGNDLIKHADTAMYVAKEQGRNGFKLFQSEMAEKEMHRFTLEHVLKKAILNQEFELYYQPQVNVDDNMIVGAECLIRWYNEQLGWVSPLEFINLAEETGYIHDIGDWVMESVCRQLKQWEENGLFEKTSCRYIAVNVSAKQFIQKDFADKVLKLVQDCGLKNLSRLELELTEGCLVHSTNEASNTLAKLRRLGLRISIDDFGTGYSSLSYLKDFPLDTLKIDQSFIKECILDRSSEAIVKAVIAMADGLGLDTVAEGVESMEQLSFIKRHGCRYYQGFLFAKPLNIKDFEYMLVNGIKNSRMLLGVMN